MTGEIMNRRGFLATAGAAALAPMLAGRAGAQPFPYDAIGRIKTAGLSPTTSLSACRRNR